jgi:hypothetical protein
MTSAGGYKRYVIKQYSQQTYQHGGVGYVDAEKILISSGFEAIEFPHQTNFSLSAKVGRFSYLLRALFSVPKKSVVVFLYPVYSKLNALLIRLLVKKGAKCICFIADINGLKDGDIPELEKEVRFFKLFSYFIVHNQAMKNWLEENMSNTQSAAIEFFDFLAAPANNSKQLSIDIAFAGNLEKSKFLEQLHQLPLYFHLYGPGVTSAMQQQKNVTYHGVEDAYALPQKIKGSFGLLWDGDGINGPEGSLGDYMKYITHHKPSLYILAGLPLIVPAIAGCAPLIEKYKIGFTINNLFEIESKIKAITPDQYGQMRSNMEDLARKISSGDCLKNALLKIEY